MSRQDSEKTGRRANVVVGSSAEGVARRYSPLYGSPKSQQGNPVDPLSVHGMFFGRPHIFWLEGLSGTESILPRCCMFEAKNFARLLPIISSFECLEITKPYRNIFGSARTPSFDRYALSAPTSPIIHVIPPP